MTEQQEQAWDDLQVAAIEARACGFAVIIWTPDELRGVDPGDVMDRSVEAGYEIISLLAPPNSNEDTD